jgi:hypothetical protein
VAIGINDLKGNRITTYYSLAELGKSFNLSAKETFKIKISEKEVRLVPGEYEVILSIKNHGQSVITWERFLTLKVSDSDVFNTGKSIVSSYQGYILSKADWKIVNN